MEGRAAVASEYAILLAATTERGPPNHLKNGPPNHPKMRAKRAHVTP